MKLLLQSHLLAMTRFLCYMALIQSTLMTVGSAKTVYGQLFEDTRIDCNWKKIPLEHAFADIQAKTDLFFTYTYETIDDILISNQNNDLSVADILKYISGETGLSFKIAEDVVYVYENDYVPEKKMRLEVPEMDSLNLILDQLNFNVVQMVSISNAAFDRIIRGTVRSEDGGELIGATVRIKGTGQGTLTDEQGQFSIAASDEEPVTLIISYIGYGSQEIIVEDQTNLEIVMTESVSDLGEVVIVGYGVTKKENLTGAVDQVSSEVLESRPISNLARGLQGVIPNLNIVFTDGTPGSTPQYNIRGITSINGGNPLIVIDGIPSDPSLVSLLNPADIESVTVLKDAASAAIFGARGAFGVILIKTKSGKSKKPTVNYNSFVGINTPTILPEAITDPYLSMSIYHEALKAWNGTGAYTEEQLEYAKARSEDPSLPEVRITNDGRYEYYGNTDWYDEIYEEYQPMTQHNLSFAGGSDRFSYYFSGGYLFQDGIYEYDSDQYERFNIRTKFDFQLTDWFKLRNNTFFNNGIYNYKTYYGGSVTLERYAVLLGNAQQIPQNPDGTWTYPSGLSIAFLRDGGPGSNNEKLFQNTVGAELSFFEDKLKIFGDYTYQTDGRNINEHYKPVTYYRNDINPGVPSTRGVSRVQNITTDNEYHVFNIYSTYDQSFGLHNMRATIGYNQELRKFSSTTARRDDLVTSDLASLNLAIGEAFVDGSASEWAVRGVFYRLNYNFDNKYLIEFNGRYDGTSRFPEEDRFGFFPSVSAGWRISSEPFFSGVSNTVTNLKLRASYGSLGNQQVPSFYAYIPTMSTFTSSVVIDGERPLGISDPGLVSPNLTWEKVTTLDFGVDIGLWNRFSLTFDWYQRETADMLTKGRTLPAVLGTSEPQENAADLETRGYEFNVKWNDEVQLLGSPFNYNLGFVFGDYTAEITHFDNPNNFLGDFYAGQEFGEIWGYETLGFFQSEEEIANSADHTGLMRRPADLAPGDLKFADLNNDGVIDEGEFTLDNPGDLKVVGNSLIRKNYGFNGGFDWKNINLSFFFQGIGQHEFLPGRDDAYMWSVYNRPYNTVLEHIVGNYWTPENRDAYFPRLFGYAALGTGKQMIAPQSRYIQDASYLRLKNLTLGYTIPQMFTRKLGIERFNIYLSGENIWEHTNMIMPTDPELLNVPGQTWGDGQNYPYQRTYSAGVNLTF